MPTSIVIAAGVVVVVIASFACAMMMNQLGKGPDLMQQVLNREPLFGKDFLDRYYSGSPRNLVFQVRSEFARLAGVPADFLLPQDNLAKLAPGGSGEAMRGFIAELISIGSTAPQSPGTITVPAQLTTLDDCIRATITLSSAHGDAAGVGVEPVGAR